MSTKIKDYQAQQRKKNIYQSQNVKNYATSLIPSDFFEAHANVKKHNLSAKNSQQYLASCYHCKLFELARE